MATDLNSVTIIGNLTRDAKLERARSGVAIVNGSIANNRSVKRGDSWESAASFFDFTIFGNLAERIHPYLQKGKRIGVTGELVQERFQDRDGNNRSKVRIYVNRIQILDLHGTLTGGSYGTTTRNSSPGPGYTGQDGPGLGQGGFDDDVPF